MIKTIVLDIGQVLAHFNWKGYMESCGYNEETLDRLSKATVLSNVWGEFDRGALSDEEITRLCCELDTGISEEIKYFIKTSYNTVQEFPYSVDFIKNLKKNGYKVYLLSNYGKTNFEYAKKNFKFIPLADGGVISYEVKSIKPEPKIYKALIDKYDINTEEAVFLDDCIPNLEAAKTFGFHTIHVTEFEKALEDLRKLDVKI
ncbi:HAD-IA family hydrolase [Anaerocolumna sedimenticola]|uniref:HAD-IA family hydrolase n=1 Tax=Anaerocolumna sedimenticola TaxID=2696063 RepID=A0A6P1TLI5_9FIRM|nr:HAD family phosphatase [Anaerocolumna sedimenticola]QHQ60992.1 HAD-IA family hydrolase [Anaerocolumna sedimenticola]